MTAHIRSKFTAYAILDEIDECLTRKRCANQELRVAGVTPTYPPKLHQRDAAHKVLC